MKKLTQNNIPQISEFSRKVYAICKTIPKGKTMSYKEIADKLHSSPRAVGQALKRNPFAPIVPCHRVISHSGKIGGFNGIRDNPKKIQLLAKEGVKFSKGIKVYATKKYSKK